MSFGLGETDRLGGEAWRHNFGEEAEEEPVAHRLDLRRVSLSVVRPKLARRLQCRLAMTESAVKRTPDSAPPNFGDLVEDALLQAKNLVQAELSLARSELSSEVKGAFGSLLLLSIGAMFLQAALVTLGVLLLLTFGVGIASGVVIAVLVAVGLTCLLIAARALGSRKLPRTSARLALDAKQVLETVK